VSDASPRAGFSGFYFDFPPEASPVPAFASTIRKIFLRRKLGNSGSAAASKEKFAANIEISCDKQ